MKGWLIDTNVVSEWRKPKPDRRITDFLAQQKRRTIWTSIVCIAEIRKGVEEAADQVVGTMIAQWLENILRPFFESRILGLSEDELLEALKIADQCERKRKRVTAADVWIAATARCNDLIVVTRNVRDFDPTGVPVLNPCTGERFNGA